METRLESTTLYYREGASDKVYQCGIEPTGGRQQTDGRELVRLPFRTEEREE